MLRNVAEHLEIGACCLLFDDCEHLLDATAEVIGSLLQVGGELRVLATSREPLAIPGESLYPVPTMELPADTARGVPGAQEAAQDTESVRLFVDRARAVQPPSRSPRRTQKR